MPRTPDEDKPEMPVPPPQTDWERSEQEKLPPRGDGSQDNQGEDKGTPRPHDLPDEESSRSDQRPASARSSPSGGTA